MSFAKCLLPALKAKSFLRKTLASLSRQQTATSNRRFEFRKCRQLFIRSHNETLSVAAMWA
jgi:hypothetical protein